MLLVAEFWATRLPAVRQGMVISLNPKLDSDTYRPHARGMGHVDDEDKNTVTIRDGIAHTREGMGRAEIQKYRFGSFAHTREGMGILVTDFSVAKYRPHARGRGMGKTPKLDSSKYRP